MSDITWSEIADKFINTLPPKSLIEVSQEASAAVEYMKRLTPVENATAILRNLADVKITDLLKIMVSLSQAEAETLTKIDAKLTEYLASYYLTGVDKFESAKKVHNAKVRMRYLRGSLSYFYQASHIGENLYAKALAEYMAGTAHGLLGERENSVEWFLRSYSSIEQLRNKTELAQDLSFREGFINFVSWCLVVPGVVRAYKTWKREDALKSLAIPFSRALEKVLLDLGQEVKPIRWYFPEGGSGDPNWAAGAV